MIPFTNYYGLQFNPFDKEISSRDAFETFEMEQVKGRLEYLKAHSDMWNKIKPYVLEYYKGTDNPEYIDIIEDYCIQVHTFDSDTNKFRYPMSENMQVFFHTIRDLIL